MMLKLSVEMIVQKESRPRLSKALQERMKSLTDTVKDEDWWFPRPMAPLLDEDVA